MYWGDGTSSSNSTTMLMQFQATHQYPAAGCYQVSIFYCSCGCVPPTCAKPQLSNCANYQTTVCVRDWSTVAWREH